MSQAAFAAVSSNLDIYRLEVAGDVIGGSVVEQVGLDFRGKFGDSLG